MHSFYIPVLNHPYPETAAPLAEYGQEPAPTPNDPWAHRSEEMRCASCMWWLKKDSPKGLYDDPRGSIGRCRRHAPTINGFPVVFSTDWCGDHKLSELV